MQLASNGKRLLTGGLDRHAKIYDVQSYQVVNTPDDFTVVAGMANGLVSMQHRQTPAEARALLPASEQSRKERQKSGASRFRATAGFKASFNPTTDVEVATTQESTRISKHDMLLRRFQYSKALDSVLVPYIRK